MKPRLVTSSKNQLEFELHEDHPLRLVRAAGRRVECVSGTVWITAYNESEDWMLGPGKVFVVPNGRLTLVEAIGTCRVRVEQPASLLGRVTGMMIAGLAKLTRSLCTLVSVPQQMR